MKKKIVVYSLGFAVCISAVAGIAFAGKYNEQQSVVTEERRLPVRSAEETLHAEALTEEISLTENIDDTEGEEKTTEYLKVYFDISLQEDGFLGALDKIYPPEIEETEEETEEEKENGEEKISEDTQEADKQEEDKQEAGNKEEDKQEENSKEENNEKNNEEEKKTDKESLTGAGMIKAAVVRVGKEQMAQTYSEKKIKQRLEFYGIYNTINKKLKEEEIEAYRYIVCALDLGMTDERTAQNAIGGDLTGEEQANLLMAVAGICGKGRNYLGYSNEQNIYADINFLCKLYQHFTEEELEQVGTLLLEEEIVADCTLRKAEYNARFLPSLTMRYSHSSIEHLEQLIGLLNSENIVAKVQMEPKMVIDEAALEEAGKDDTNETDKEVCLGRLEYDLVLEFESKEDMKRFSEVVEEYAQVDSEEQAVYLAEENPIVLQAEQNKEIVQIVIENENAKLELYCLEEQQEEIKGKIMELLAEKEIVFYEVKTENSEEEDALEKAATDEVVTGETTTDEVATEEATTGETDETEEDAEQEAEPVGLKLYSRAYICNKEFFYMIGGEESVTEESEAVAE